MRSPVLGLAAALCAIACSTTDPLFCESADDCQDPSASFCDVDGDFGPARTCIPNPGDVDAGLLPADALGTTDAMQVCSPGTSRCDGPALKACTTDGLREDTQQCALGCLESPARCGRFEPSNNLQTYLEEAKTRADVLLQSGAVIDTDAATVTNGNGASVVIPTAVVASLPVDMLVLPVKSLVAHDVTVTGSRALAIVSAEELSIEGVFSVSARGFTSGPGAVLSDSTCRGSNGLREDEYGAGGGGGGFGSAGGSGGGAYGKSLQGAAPGTAVGNPTLVPLRGGCPGGFANGQTSLPATDEYAGPGGAGGAVQLVSGTRVTIVAGAFVASNGGAGKSYTGGGLSTCLPGVPCSGGRGGGAGGAVLLEAPEVFVARGGGLVANGGAGDCGFVGEAQAGLLSHAPAAGLVCAATGVGDGGNGGSVLQSPGSGTSNTYGGGGGGGGVGRIRINVAPTASFSLPEGAIVSPAPSIGAIAVR